jgi:U3 small nucleolar RNA-associated protein 20
LTASDSLVPSGGSLSSSLTADGLLRFPDSKKKTSMAQGILDILGSSYDWEKERDLLNSTDMSVSC